MKEKENEVKDFSKIKAKTKSEPRGLGGLKGISEERRESKTEIEQVLRMQQIAKLTGIKYHRLKDYFNTKKYIRLTVSELEALSKIINTTLVALAKKLKNVQIEGFKDGILISLPAYPMKESGISEAQSKECEALCKKIEAYNNKYHRQKIRLKK